MDLFKRCGRVGGGGYKCPCCGPKPGKERKAFRRLTKRRLRQEDFKSFKSPEGDE